VSAKPKIGRPRVPKKLVKGSLLSVRFSDGERRTLDEVARLTGLTLSEWVRRQLLAATALARTSRGSIRCLRAFGEVLLRLNRAVEHGLLPLRPARDSFSGLG
jgi:hypothetical protein